MIDVRLINRTHYQVSEPAYLTLLVRKCASPTSSTYREVVAQRFFENTERINIAASKYAVDLARSLNLLNSNFVWTELGHLLNIVAPESNIGTGQELSISEKIFFFRLFLEFDGAALIFLARKLENQQQLPASDETWAQIAQELFLNTYEEYLSFVTDLQARTRIRHLSEKRRYSPFKGNSGPHQSLVHMNLLLRAGLLDQSGTGQGRVYLAKRYPGENNPATSRLLTEVPDLKALEELLASGSLYDVVGRILGVEIRNESISDSELMGRVRSVYTRVLETGVSLCPLQTVSEALQIQSLTENTNPESHANFLSRLRTLQNSRPGEIRFHVDRYGHPAYLKIETAG